MRKPIFFIILFFLIAGFLQGASAQTSVKEFDEKLAEMAVGINKNAPQMGENSMRMDSVTTLPGKKVVYHYTITESDKMGLDYTASAKNMKENMVNNIKSNPKMKGFRNNDVTMIYKYYDQHGKLQVTFDIQTGLYK